MKARNIPLIIITIFSSAMFNMNSLSFAIDYEQSLKAEDPPYRTGSNSNLGYKPVRDLCPNLEGVEELKGNHLYKEWCEETFKDGCFIYNGYKDIAFNIKYEPEAAKSDFWQTPSETSSSQNGDCEDAVFLFFSHLSSIQKNAEIVWGWVIDNQTNISKAHVWYQLRGNDGRKYIVEGFSKDWNGIIPMDIVEQTETRKSILTISHSEVSRLARIIHRPNSLKAFQVLADIHGSASPNNNETENEYFSNDPYTRYHLDSKNIENHNMSPKFKMPWKLPVKQGFNIAMSKEISKIFKKLHVLFTRYDKQMSDGFNNSHATNRITNSHTSNNLICRR